MRRKAEVEAPAPEPATPEEQAAAEAAGQMRIPGTNGAKPEPPEHPLAAGAAVSACGEAGASAKQEAPAGAAQRTHFDADRLADLAAVTLVSVDRIDPSPFQSRTHFGDEEELTRSIREIGVQQPIKVRPAGEGRYSLVFGERRLRAARAAGLTEIPAFVCRMDDREALLAGTTENLQRKSLSPVDEARNFAMLAEAGYTQEQIGELCDPKRSQATISISLRLLRLPPGAQALLAANNKLTAGHGQAVYPLRAHAAICEQILALAAEKGLSANELERMFERELPFAAELQTAGLVGTLEWKRAQACAKECPRGAYHETKSLYGARNFCFAPDHLAELEAQEREATLEQARPVLAKAPEEAKAHLRQILKDAKQQTGEEDLALAAAGQGSLPWGTYHDFYSEKPPQGCTFKKCPKILPPAGNRDAWRCLDNACYKRLTTAATKAERAERKDALGTLQAQALAVLTGPLDAALTAHLLAPAVESLLRSRGDRVVGPAAKLVGVQWDAKAWAGAADLPARFAALAAVGPDALCRLLAALEYQTDMLHRVDGDTWGDRKVPEWLVGLDPAPRAPAWPEAGAVGEGGSGVAECPGAGTEPQPDPPPPPAPAPEPEAPEAPPLPCLRCLADVPRDVFDLRQFPDLGPVWMGPWQHPNGVEVTHDGYARNPQGGVYCPTCAPTVRFCRMCGCTDEAGCEGGCAWIEADLCSACVGVAPEPEAPAVPGAPTCPACGCGPDECAGATGAPCDSELALEELGVEDDAPVPAVPEIPAPPEPVRFAVSQERLAEVEAAYSGDRIEKGKVRAIIDEGGHAWVITGGESKGNWEGCRAVARPLWQGEVLTYAEAIKRNGYGDGFYAGILVTCRRAEYVLTNEPAVWVLAEEVREEREEVAAGAAVSACGEAGVSVKQEAPPGAAQEEVPDEPAFTDRKCRRCKCLLPADGEHVCESEGA